MKSRLLIGLGALLLCSSPALALGPNQLGTIHAGGVTGHSNWTMPVLPDQGCDCIDLVLVIDVTGSMGGAIANVAAGIDNIVDLAVAQCGNPADPENGQVQVGLVTFHDDVIVNHPLTTNISAVKASILGLSAGGGDNEPEASDESLREVITATTCPLTGDFDPNAFRTSCCKVTVLVTDARPGGCDDFYDAGVDKPNAHLRALDFAAAGVKIGALFVPTFGDPGDIVNIMTDYAATTGGVYGETLSDGSGTADAIQQVILGCTGAAETEFCCLQDGTCLEVLQGQCRGLGGEVVPNCDACNPTATESMSWGRVKTRYE